MFYNVILIIGLIVFIEILNSNFNNQIIAYSTSILLLCSIVCFLFKIEIFALVIIVVYFSVFTVFFFFSFYKNSLILENIIFYKKYYIYFFFISFFVFIFLYFFNINSNYYNYFWFDFLKASISGSNNIKFNSILHYLFFKIFLFENIVLNIILLVAVFSVSSLFILNFFKSKNVKVFLKNKKTNKRKVTAIKWFKK